MGDIVVILPPDGGGGGDTGDTGGGKGGGNTGGGTGGGTIAPPIKQTNPAQSAAANIALITPSGGLAGLTSMMLMPVMDLLLHKPYVLAVDPFTTRIDEDIVYVFRQEDIALEREQTIKGVIVQYRDLGPFQITFILEGQGKFGPASNPLIKNPNSQETQTELLGNIVATGKSLSRLINIQLTDKSPQLTMIIPGNQPYSGGVDIISVTLIGNAVTTPII